MKGFKTLIFFLMALMFSSQNSCVVPSTLNVRYIDNQQNVNNLTNSVVALVRRTPLGGTRPYCSAFFVSQNLIATAAHCLARPGESPLLDIPAPGVMGQEVLFSTYSQFRNTRSTTVVPISVAHVIAINLDTDVALLRTQNTTSSNYLSVTSRVPQIGSRVYVLGLPGGLPWLLTEGILASLEYNDSNAIVGYVATPSIFFGSSGGPLIDNFGNVIGIVKAMAFRQSNFGLYTPISQLLQISNNMIVDTSSHSPRN